MFPSSVIIESVSSCSWGKKYLSIMVWWATCCSLAVLPRLDRLELGLDEIDNLYSVGRSL